jgi:hypothetical protein
MQFCGSGLGEGGGGLDRHRASGVGGVRTPVSLACDGCVSRYPLVAARTANGSVVHGRALWEGRWSGRVAVFVDKSAEHVRPFDAADLLDACMRRLCRGRGRLRSMPRCGRAVL